MSGGNLTLDFNADADPAIEMQIVLLGRTTLLTDTAFIFA